MNEEVGEVNTITKRALWIGAALLGGVAIALAPGMISNQQAAQAEQVRQRCIKSLANAKSWRAKITHTERASDGKTSVVTEELAVRRPGEYRLTLHETDEDGRPVVSATVRTAAAMYTRRVNADGSTELHEIRGVRPTLGVCLDNELGQTLTAVSEAKQLAVIGSHVRNGREADELRLGPGHSVWVDRATGLPIAEQTRAGDVVISELEYDEIVVDEPLGDVQFEPASLGDADTTVVEDLGFKHVDRVGQARGALGFMPLDVPVPSGYSRDVQGYADPGVPSGEGPAEAAFVTGCSDGTHGVIVTQTHRPDLNGSLPPAAEGEPEAAHLVDIGGAPALVATVPDGQQLTTVRGEILVTIEGALSESEITALAASIR